MTEQTITESSKMKMVKKEYEPEIILDGEGPVTFKILTNGSLSIEVFQQNFLTEIVDVKERNKLTVWLVNNNIETEDQTPPEQPITKAMDEAISLNFYKTKTEEERVQHIDKLTEDEAKMILLAYIHTMAELIEIQESKK
jgi:hypothetical protein